MKDRYKTSKKGKSLGKSKSLTASEAEIDEVIVAFKEYVTENIKGEKITHNAKRAYELHPSSFPYCGLRHSFEIMENGGVDEYQSLDFFGDFYTSVGTVVHELIQEWLGKGRSLYGDWKCKNRSCKGKRDFSVYKPCPKCKGEMRYEELQIKFGKYTIGHVDGLFYYKGKYYVIDYKTSGSDKINKNITGMDKSFPYLKNKAQIESYCYYLYKKYKIKVRGWILVYLSRDNAFKTYIPVGQIFDKEYKARIKEQLTFADKHFGIAINMKKRTDLIDLVEEKPCKCPADYQANFHDRWNPCPLSKNNICFNKPRLEKTLDTKWKAYKKLLKKKSKETT